MAMASAPDGSGAADKSPLFMDVQDTPLFAQQVDELNASAKRLKDKCNGAEVVGQGPRRTLFHHPLHVLAHYIASVIWFTGLLVGARRYRDALAAMSDAQRAFSGVLAEFGGGVDEDSLLLGAQRTS